MGVGGDALEGEDLEGQRQDQGLRLLVDARAPVLAAQPGADDRAAVALGQLGQARDPERHVVRPGDHELQALAGVALRGHPLDERERLADVLVGPPREPARHFGVAAQLQQRVRVVRPRVAQPQARSADDHRQSTVRSAGP